MGAATATATTTAGVATLLPTAGTVVGGYAVVATVPTGSQSASFSLTNLLGPPSKVSVVSGSPQNQNVNVNFGASLVAQVTDAYGNPVGSGVTVNLTVPGSGATATVPATASTDSSGRITVTAKAGTVIGSYSLTAQVPSGSQSATFALTNTPGVPYEVDVVSGGTQSQNANTAFSAPLVAKVVDQYGNLAGSGITVTFAPPTGTGVATATVAASAVTGSSSQVSVPATAGTVAGSYSVVASVTGGTVTASFALTNTAGPAVAVALVGSAGDNQSKAVNTAFDNNLIVQVSDVYGNAVGANVLVTYTAPGSGATASLGSAGNANTTANGQVSLPATAGTVVGSYTVTAAVSGGTTQATFHLTNLLGTLTHVSAVSGSGQSATVGGTFANLVAQVSDDYGNPAGSGTSVSFAVTAEPNATLSATSASTTASGQVSVGATAGHIAGNYNIIASITGGTTTATFALTNSAGPATAVSVVSGDAQSQNVTVAFTNPLVVQVADVYGNAVGANVTVNWTVPASTGATAGLSSNSGPTDANGKVSVTATAGSKSGAYTVSAAVTGGTSSASFSLTNRPGAASTVAPFSGSPQSTPANANFTNPLVVLVTDAQGNPVSGVTVTFAPPLTNPNATLSALTPVTDANGKVSVVALAGTQAGTYAVPATVPGVTTPASFALTNIAGPAATLAVIQGNDQNTLVNTAFAAVVVQVTDTYSNPVANAVVSAQPPASGATASLAATPGATDANGKTNLTLNANTVAGSYTVSVSTTGVTPATSLRLSNVAGAAAKIAAASGNNQHATVGTALTPLGVVVSDAYGNPVSGVVVTVTVPTTNPNAMLVGTPASTDAGGSTTVPLNAGTVPGTYTVSVAAAGVSTPISFTLTNDVGPLATLTASSGTGQSATVHTAFAAPLVVQAVDAYGNPVANANITFAGPVSGAGIATASTVLATDANGLASLTVVANNTAGAYSVSASAATGTPVTFSLTNNHGAVASVTPVPGTSPQSTQVGGAFSTTLVMQVSDSYGNAISGVSVGISAPSTGASATLGSASNGGVTDSQGQISITATANTVIGTYNVTATPAASSVSGAWVLTNTAAPAANIVVRSGDNQSVVFNSATLAPLVAQVTDQYGNAVSGISVTFTVPSSGATLNVTNTTFTSNAGGLVGLTGTANAIAGSYSVTAAATGVTPIASFTVNNVASGNLSFSKISGDNQSTQVTTAFAQPLVMELHDAANNPIAGVTVSFSSTGGASLSATALSTDANGIVSLSAGALSSAGPLQVTATLNSTTQATFSLTATPGPVVALVPDVAASSQSATGGQAFTQPLGLTAVDAWGNPVSGTSVTFAAPSTGATGQLSATTATTDANGHAQITVTAGNVAGSYPVTATLAGSGSATASYTLTNLTGSPSVLHVLSGDGNSTTVHTAFAQPFEVQLLDANGSPLAGVAVTFAAPATGATATPTAVVVTTDAQGKAQMQATAGDVAGSYVISATATGSSSPALIHVTNNAGAAVAAVPDAAGSSQSAVAGNGFVNPLGVTVVDAYGNPVAGVSVTYSAPASGATAVLPSVTTVTTDAQGHAQIVATAGSTAGDYQVSATVAGVTTPAVWNLTNSTDAPLILLSAVSTTQSTAVGSAFTSLVVLVHDAFGGPVPGAEIDFTGPSSGAGAVFASSLIADANGLVTLPITANAVAGSYIVSATVANGSAPLLFNLHNTETQATQLLVSATSSPQSATVSTPFSVALQVRVLDASGNPVVGAVVQFTLPGSGPTVQLSATSVITDAQGYAQVVAIAGSTAGAVSVGVSVDNTSLTATLQLTNLDVTGNSGTPGTPDTLTLQSGGGQTGFATHPFSDPLVFVLRDSGATAHAGVVVSFASQPEGLTLSAAAATTDGAGIVEVHVTAGIPVGSFTVTASAPATAAPASATLTVEGIPTTTSLTLSEDTLDPGQSVLLTAKVQASDTPQGKVDFFVDGTRVTTVPCDANGQATTSRGAPNPGTHNVTAVFVPNAPFGASQSDAATVTVTNWVISGGGCTALGSSGGGLMALAAMLGLLRRVRRSRQP